MNKTLKIEFYDTFKCIADKCSFTCCKGWDISVDSDTYNKWKSNSRQIEFCNNIKVTKGKETNYSFKMGSHKTCPFLTEKELCNIIIQCGDEYLSSTCKTFPRLENESADLKEFSLSCACPEVVDFLSSLKDNLQFSYDGSTYPFADIPFLNYTSFDNNITSSTNHIATSTQIRATMISIIQNQPFSIKDRLLLVFHMLLCMRDNTSDIKDVINIYQYEENLLSTVDTLKTIKVNSKDTCLELNELFLDIVLNYKREKHYRNYLKDIFDLAQVFNIEENLIHWNTFHMIWRQYDKILENCIVSKIYSNCINDDIDDLIMSFQMIITEFIMIKYSSFLRWILNDKMLLDYPELRDYIVIFSRIIGYNTDGMIEFWEDNFDDAIWELGYLLLITCF